jgi:hypothetical protein
MAMISCPKCDGKVSDLAASCPNCAYPLVQNSESKKATQKKGGKKKWLGVQLTGSIMVIIGLFLFGMADLEDSGILHALLIFTFLFFGLILLFSAKISARWLK